MQGMTEWANAGLIDFRRRAHLKYLGAAALASTPIAAMATQAPRLVSIGGALTEIIYQLKAQDHLVGVDTTSLFPTAAQQLPNVGYARSLSLEGILALAPSLVIATEDAGPPMVLRQLKTSGIEVSVLRADHRFEGLLNRVKAVGEVTHRTRASEALQQKLKEEWGQVRDQLARRSKHTKARVLFVLTHSPGQLLVAGSDTSAEAMLVYAGAANAIGGFTGYKPLTPEAVIAAQPDVVLLSDQGLKSAGGAHAILQWPGMAQTPAGQRQRVISMETMLLLGFGPRLPLAVSTLAASIDRAIQT